SRRRHTSFSRDWSSDVCSSDLHRDIALRGVRHLLARAIEVRIGGVDEPRSDLRSPRAAVEILLAAEQVFTGTAIALVDTARSQESGRAAGRDRVQLAHGDMARL